MTHSITYLCIIYCIKTELKKEIICLDIETNKLEDINKKKFNEITMVNKKVVSLHTSKNIGDERQRLF